ncbi:MAG: polysaccharide biosynthesis protein [Chloroflexi bacterium]|nr:polysaccharide biosynthesis protein [Chloroflexota bacterium]
MRRLFDIVAALFGLILLFPLFLIVAIAIKLESRGPAFYRGERLGKDGARFRIYKFRTMVANAARLGGGLTHRGDPRVTRFGRVLRRTKIDELPQLINVFRGEMSFVGPRPEDPRYLPYYSPRYRQVLAVQPGITSIASIRYRNEEQLLPADNWEKVYVGSVLPAKLDIELSYLATQSPGQDLLIMLATGFALLKDEAHFDRLTRAVTRFELFVERYASWVVIDTPLIVLAYALALAVRSITAQIDLPLAFAEALVGVALYVVTNQFFGIYHRVWRYASGQESVMLFASVTTATLAISLVNLLMPTRALPLGAIWLGGFFSFVFLAAVRYRRNLISGLRRAVEDYVGFASGEGARVLVIGAKDIGQIMAYQLQNHLRTYQVVAFVDDDRQTHGMRIHNIPVFGGRDRIPELVARLHVDLILVAIPLSKADGPRELLKLCRSTQAQIKVIPSLGDLLTQNGHVPNWVDIDDEELLERASYRVDEESCRQLLTDRVVMVTGAAGSVGSELCRQIAGYRPSRLVMVDINESGLHDLYVELQGLTPAPNAALVLGDISSHHRMHEVFEQTRPQIVFHAAAYKHVPILEEYPGEAVRVNVLGTRILHQLAEQFAVERFILISSDKAVNPTNVLGMSKRFGELIVTAESNRALRSTAVRFGNVLGSRGSVIPTFSRQIDMGGPITLTHADMTRYFLSIAEAVSLVIQAAAITQGGDIYVLDMGLPMSIADLAHRMIRARGLRPGQDIAIEYVGPRPGEKMSEELVACGEKQVATDHPSILRIVSPTSIDPAELTRHIDDLVHAAGNGTTPQALALDIRQSLQALETSDEMAVPSPARQLVDAKSSGEN